MSPYADCVFVYRELVRPDYPFTGEIPEPVTPLRVAREINKLERAWKEPDWVQMSLMSHEAKSERDTYIFDLAEHERLNFASWGTNRRGGIAQVRQYLEIDRTRPHPFRRYPKGHTKEGEALLGRPRLYLIVDDNEGALAVGDEGGLVVAPAKTAKGLRRLRDEFPEYHYKTNQAGDESEDPYALFNDAMDAVRGLAARFFPQSEQASAEDRALAAFKDKYPGMTPEAIRLKDPEVQGVALIVSMTRFDAELEKAERGGEFVNPRVEELQQMEM
jgi:hypothetical protein